MQALIRFFRATDSRIFRVRGGSILARSSHSHSEMMEPNEPQTKFFPSGTIFLFTRLVLVYAAL